MNFWKKLKKPFTVLAPMANVTDWAFRQIVIEAGRPDVFYTQFISADGINAVGIEKFRRELYFTKNEKPIVVQFFTSIPENMYKCSLLAQELGFDGVDINMGCPDKSIEKQGAGAALIKNPKLAEKIIREAIRGAGKLPVSVKTRLGYSIVDFEWIKTLLNTGIMSLAIHGRTRRELSKVSAHWDELGEVVGMKEAAGKVIIGNGDVVDIKDLNNKANKYNLDGIMIGRGIFANPWFFSGKNIKKPEERVKMLIRHLDNFQELWGNGRNFDTMKRFFKIYINGWPAAKDLRADLMTAKNKDETLSHIFKSFPDILR